MLDERHPKAIKVRLVLENLNTHEIASLYETFPPAEARRLAKRLEIYSPQALQLAEHRGNRIERAQLSVPASPHPFTPTDAVGNRGLAV